MRSMSYLLALALTLLANLSCHAQTTFPTRNVTLFVPFAAGGPTDVIMRIVAERLSASWGKSVIIDNRPGAGTIVATAAVAKAPPDGHALGVATNAFVINPAINHGLPYDTLKDFVGLSMVATVPVVLVAPRSFAPDSIADVISLANKSGEPLNFTSPGPRGVGHFAGEWLQSVAHIKMTHVAYNGSAPALTDVLAGRVPLMFDLWNSVKPHVVDGRLKVLAVASADRLRDAPRYPTLAESYPGFNAAAFQAIIGPSGMPATLVDKISADIRTAVSSPEFAEKMEPLGALANATTGRELDQMLRNEIDRWAAIAKAANIKVD